MISVEGGRGSVSLPRWEWYERGWGRAVKRYVCIERYYR